MNRSRQPPHHGCATDPIVPINSLSDILSNPNQNSVLLLVYLFQNSIIYETTRCRLIIILYNYLFHKLIEQACISLDISFWIIWRLNILKPFWVVFYMTHNYNDKNIFSTLYCHSIVHYYLWAMKRVASRAAYTSSIRPLKTTM